MWPLTMLFDHPGHTFVAYKVVELTLLSTNINL